MIDAVDEKIIHLLSQDAWQSSETLAKQIEGKTVALKGKVGAKDQLYGSITNTDVANGLSKLLGIEIDKRKVELAEPIRHTGTLVCASPFR